MRRVGVDGIGQGVSDDVVLVRRRPGIFRTPARTCADPSGWWTGDQSRQHRPRVRQVVDVGCARHFSSPLESETTLGCAAADRAVVEGPEGELGHWVSQCRCQSKALVRLSHPTPSARRAGSKEQFLGGMPWDRPGDCGSSPTSGRWGLRCVPSSPACRNMKGLTRSIGRWMNLRLSPSRPCSSRPRPPAPSRRKQNTA